MVIAHKFHFCFIMLFLCFTLHSQNLNLKVWAKNEKQTAIIDSFGYTKIFENYKSIETEINNLKTKLIHSGFIDIYVENITKTNDTLFVANVVLGKPVRHIRVYYNQDFDANLLRYIKHKKGKNYFEVEVKALENSLKTLNLKITEQGQPFSTLQLKNITKQTPNLITAQPLIKTNTKRKIDKILVKGYEKFSKSYLKHFLKLKPDQVLNLTQIKTKTQQLKNLPFVSQIRIPEVLFTKDSTTLYVYLKKHKANNFDGFLGFGTNEQTNKLQFDGYLDLRLINNLNYGEQLNLYYKSDEIDQQTFSVNAKLPYLFASPIGAEVGLRIFRKDSTFLNANQFAKLNYQIYAQHTIALGISSTNSINLLSNNTQTINDYNNTFYNLSYQYTKAQFSNLLFPVNTYFEITSGFGNRKSQTNSQKQNIFNVNAFKIINLNPKNSVFIKTQAAYLNSNNYLDNELFRFGGINSIRGFEENSLVANLFGVLNTEYRYQLSQGIYVHSIIDAAYFENKITTQKEKLFGFGFGFGLLTNAGLFRLNYATAKTENTNIKLADSKVHISLTTQF